MRVETPFGPALTVRCRFKDKMLELQPLWPGASPACRLYMNMAPLIAAEDARRQMNAAHMAVEDELSRRCAAPRRIIEHNRKMMLAADEEAHMLRQPEVEVRPNHSVWLCYLCSCRVCTVWSTRDTPGRVGFCTHWAYRDLRCVGGCCNRSRRRCWTPAHLPLPSVTCCTA